jgi:hypothetical protein
MEEGINITLNIINNICVQRATKSPEVEKIVS